MQFQLMRAALVQASTDCTDHPQYFIALQLSDVQSAESHSLNMRRMCVLDAELMQSAEMKKNTPVNRLVRSLKAGIINVNIRNDIRMFFF